MPNNDIFEERCIIDIEVEVVETVKLGIDTFVPGGWDVDKRVDDDVEEPDAESCCACTGIWIGGTDGRGFTLLCKRRGDEISSVGDRLSLFVRSGSATG